MNDVDQVIADFSKRQAEKEFVPTNTDVEEEVPESKDGVNESKPVELTLDEQVDKMIKENKIMVFSKSWCPFSLKTKETLKNMKLEFKVYEIDKEANGP